VRQEVVKALVAIGGEQAASLLVRFLNDKDIDIRFMAVRGLGTIGLAGQKQERALIECVRGRWFRKGDLDLRREAVSSLGMIGGRAAEECLSKLLARKPRMGGSERESLANAARDAIERISGRPAHG
jgi:HEAT repeat protein